MLNDMVGMSVSANGLSGSLIIVQIVIPYWVGIVAAILGLFMLATNIVRFSSVPRWIIAGLFLSAALMTFWSLVVIISNGTISIGILLFSMAIGIGLFQFGKTETELSNQ